MKSIIQGKNLKTTYRVDYKWKTIKNENGEEVTVYTGKPELIKETVIDGWETIKEFDEDINCNEKLFIFGNLTNTSSINLSENETIKVEEKIFRVDLGAYVYRTDKVLKETELYKDESEDILVGQIKAFNKMMIESNERLLVYCNLHKLDPNDTDVYELAKVVYTDGYNRAYIEEGKFIVEKLDIIVTSAGYSIRDIAGSSLMADAYKALTTNYTSKNR